MPKPSLFGLVGLLTSVTLIHSCNRPIAEFTHTTDTDRVPTQVHFTNHSRHASDFLWDFGDGSQSDHLHPQKTYYLSGTYVVRLIARRGMRADTAFDTLQLFPPAHCMVRIHTPLGDMLAELSDETPLHRDNFTRLVELGYYRDAIFHRVVPGFVIQGGVHPVDSSVGFRDEPDSTIAAEIHPQLIHLRGALGAARLSDQMNPQRASSPTQFYIVQGHRVTEALLDRIEAENGILYTDQQRQLYLRYGGTPELDGKYTVFGYVRHGFEVIDSIAAVPRDERDRPLRDIPMQITLIR